MGVLPPWKYVIGPTRRQEPAGYALIFSPPHPRPQWLEGVEVDTTRLLIQALVVAGLTVVAILLPLDRHVLPQSRNSRLDVLPGGAGLPLDGLPLRIGVRPPSDPLKELWNQE